MNYLLSQEYCKILNSVPNIGDYLDKPFSCGGRRPKNLSGLFLTSVGSNYNCQKNKIMVVGCETAGWEVLKRVLNGKTIYDDFKSISEYVGRAMAKHQIFFQEQINQKKSDRGNTFHNFTRNVATVCDNSSLIYSNLFCFDWKKGSPIKSPEFNFIKNLSMKLLHAQIDLLQPNYIIFANGISTAQYRREYFPIDGDGKRCISCIDWVKEQNIENRHLWGFTLDNRIKCFRIHHPSARGLKAREARNYLLELLGSEINDPKA